MTGISWVNVDRFALADLRRERGLSPSETYLLEQMAKDAGPRGARHFWTGTASDLAEFTGQGRGTVMRGVARLVATGCLAELEPFRQGTEGVYEVLVYDRWILSPAEVKRLSNEKRSRRDRAQIETDDAIDQDIRDENGDPPLGSKGRGGRSRVPLTRNAPALGSFLRAFPGAEEVG